MEKLEELRSLFTSLYPEDCFSRFEHVLESHRKKRSPQLKELDRQRQASGRWYLKGSMIGMTMYTDLFAGNLKGLEEKVPYLKELGISYLHLMPLMKMPHPDNDGGYAVEDFRTVDPLFGTNSDLASLATTLRENGISLCMDFVMNHSADSHEWAVRAKRGEEKYRRYYYIYPDRAIPDEFEKTVPEVFPATAPGNFIYSTQLGAYVMSSFYPFQWDLDYHNPDVFIEMVSAMLDMANLGVECFRLDAVPYIWKELGTSCRNLPQVHVIVRMFRLALELVCPAVILKGEVVMAPRELKAYFGTPEAPECHLLYGVTTMVNLWSAMASQDIRLLEKHLEEVFSLPSHCRFVNYLRCHDDIGWGLDEDAERQLGIDPLRHKIFLYDFYIGAFPGSYARGQLYNYDPESLDARSCGTTASLCGLEKARIDHSPKETADALSRIILLHRTCYAIEGFPMLNSGDEIVQLNDYSYMNDPDRAADSRNLHRSPFNWDKARLRKDPSSTEGLIFTELQNLGRLRSDHPCFSDDACVRTWLSHNDSVIAVRRTQEEHDLLCVSNFSDRTQTVHFDFFIGRYRDIFTASEFEPGLGLDIPAWSCLYLEKCQNM